MSALFLGFIFALVLLVCFIGVSLLHRGGYQHGPTIPVLRDHDAVPPPAKPPERR